MAMLTGSLFNDVFIMSVITYWMCSRPRSNAYSWDLVLKIYIFFKVSHIISHIEKVMCLSTENPSFLYCFLTCKSLFQCVRSTVHLRFRPSHLQLSCSVSYTALGMRTPRETRAFWTRWPRCSGSRRTSTALEETRLPSPYSESPPGALACHC